MLGGGCCCPNSQIEFEGQGRACGIGNMSFFATWVFFFFLLNQKVVIIKQNLRDTKQPQFVFVLIGVETKQPIVICLSEPKWPGQNTAPARSICFCFLFFPFTKKSVIIELRSCIERYEFGDVQMDCPLDQSGAKNWIRAKSGTDVVLQPVFPWKSLVSVNYTVSHAGQTICQCSFWWVAGVTAINVAGVVFAHQHKTGNEWFCTLFRVYCDYYICLFPQMVVDTVKQILLFA